MKTETREIENFISLAQDSLEQFHKLNVENLSRLSELQLEFINLCAECNKAQLDRMAKAESPSDAMAAGPDIATEYSTKFFENARQIFDAANQMQSNMLTWLTENDFAQQFEKIASSSTTDNKQQNKAKRKTGKSAS
jgi:phasin family protein